MIYFKAKPLATHLVIFINVSQAIDWRAEVVTRLLHDPGDAQSIHLCHGERLHTQQFHDVAVEQKEDISNWSKMI